MSRVCYKCNLTKPLIEFKKNKRLTSGYSYCCKICHNKCYRGGNTIRHKLRLVYRGIEKRCLNMDGEHPSYANVQLQMTFEEFLTWATPLYENFIKNHPNVTPSFDRIKSSGHYSISNLQIISLSENSKRRHRPDNVDDICHHVQVLCKSSNIPITEVISCLQNQIVKDQGV